MSENNVVKSLSEHYRQVMYSLENDYSEDEIRLSVVANFVNAYMDSIYQTVYQAKNDEDRIASVFVLEMMSNIQNDFSRLTEDMSVEEKAHKMIEVLTNIQTPSYENVKPESVRIKLIDSAKDDFNSMAEFLAG